MFFSESLTGWGLNNLRRGPRLKPARESSGPFSRCFVLDPHNVKELLAQVRSCQTYKFTLAGKTLTLEQARQNCLARTSGQIDIVYLGANIVCREPFYLIRIWRCDPEVQTAVSDYLSSFKMLAASKEQAGTAGTLLYVLSLTETGSAA
ncbi:MAG: hypothetical protein JW873_00090 [Candidatus Saganbacteria bacterium]|nr:hypothetical protein [Candidatus Saganbacteria bacterium]